MLAPSRAIAVIESSESIPSAAIREQLKRYKNVCAGYKTAK